MELEEMVTKLIIHLDQSLAKNKTEIINIMEQRLAENSAENKKEIIREVSVLLEQQHSQFNTFGDGLQIIQTKIDSLAQKVDGLSESMEIVKPTLSNMNNRFDIIESEIIKLNPESRAILKQVK